MMTQTAAKLPVLPSQLFSRHTRRQHAPHTAAVINEQIVHQLAKVYPLLATRFASTTRSAFSARPTVLTPRVPR